MRAASGPVPAATALAQAPAAAIGDLAIIRKLTSVADISRLLHDTLARERAVDQELEQLLGRRLQVEQGLLGLRGSTAEVGEQGLHLVQTRPLVCLRMEALSTPLRGISADGCW